MNQAAVLKSQYRYNQTQVIYLTKINEAEYHDFLIDTAKAWATYYLKGIIDTETLLKTLLFWKWWSRWWNDIDDRFILQQLYSIPFAQRYGAYREMHQYVFDDSEEYQQYLMKDFVTMKLEFEKEIKKLKKHEQA